MIQKTRHDSEEMTHSLIQTRMNFNRRNIHEESQVQEANIYFPDAFTAGHVAVKQLRVLLSIEFTQ